MGVGGHSLANVCGSVQDSGVSASTSDMHDTYLELKEQETPTGESTALSPFLSPSFSHSLSPSLPPSLPPETGQGSTLEELSSRATSRLAQLSCATSRLAQLSRAPTAMGMAGHTLMPGQHCHAHILSSDAITTCSTLCCGACPVAMARQTPCRQLPTPPQERAHLLPVSSQKRDQSLVPHQAGVSPQSSILWTRHNPMTTPS